MKKVLKLVTPLALLLSIASCNSNISNSDKNFSVPPAVDSTISESTKIDSEIPSENSSSIIESESPSESDSESVKPSDSESSSDFVPVDYTVILKEHMKILIIL